MAQNWLCSCNTYDCFLRVFSSYFSYSFSPVNLFGWGVLRWVAWTIWSDACLLDQITYEILVLYSLDFLRGGENTVSKDDHLKPRYIIKVAIWWGFFQTISEKNFHSYHYITLWFSEIVNYKWPSIQSMPTKWQMGRRPLLLIIWWTYTFTVFFENQIFLKYYIPIHTLNYYTLGNELQHIYLEILCMHGNTLPIWLITISHGGLFAMIKIQNILIYLLNILVNQRCNVLQEDVVLKICIKKDERKNM